MSEAQEEAKRSTAAMAMDGPRATSPLAPEMCKRTIHKSAGWTSQPTVWNMVLVRQHRHRSRPRHHIVSSRLSPARLLVDASTMHKGVFVCKENSSSPQRIFWQLSGRWCWVAPPWPSQSLVILCNCWVWCELGRRRASSSQHSRRDESNELSSVLPESCVFPQEGWQRGTAWSFFSLVRGVESEEDRRKRERRMCLPKMQDSRTSCVWLWARRAGRRGLDEGGVAGGAGGGGAG